MWDQAYVVKWCGISLCGEVEWIEPMRCGIKLVWCGGTGVGSSLCGEVEWTEPVWCGGVGSSLCGEVEWIEPVVWDRAFVVWWRVIRIRLE